VISADALGAWKIHHPWADDDQVEQDLIMTRVAIEIAEHPALRDRLAWRGGTCLHKLFLPKALRFSEDLDYVAYDLSIEANDMRMLRTGLRDVAESVELSVAKNARTTRTRLTEHLGYVDHRGQQRRLKVEINLDEVPAVHPLDRRRLGAVSDWWSGSADLLTFEPVELIATKFRALAQRSKGRDINDLDVAHRQLALDNALLGKAAAHYLFYADVHPGEFRARLAAHLGDPDFVVDVAAYLIDPATAGDPRTLVNRWIHWTDQHLDLAFAQLAADRAPSKRKQRAIEDIQERLATGTGQCPVHDYDGQAWRRCPRQLDVSYACPDHGPVQTV